jgi:hypothetical protein
MSFTTEPARNVVATPFSQIARKQVEWLDPGRVPIGLVTVIAGYGGLGKSQWMLSLCARLSRGEFGAPGVSLIATAEDDEETTVRPRLEAAQANLELVHSITVRMDDGIEDGLSLPDDLDRVEAQVAALGAKLLVVDPIVSFLPSHIDSHKDQSVRRALAPLYRLARTHGCTVVACIHLNKAHGLKPLQRLNGSGGFGNAARSVLLLDHDPDDPAGEEGNRRVLAHIKCNVAAHAPSLTYQLTPILLPAADGMPEVETSRLELVGESTHNGESLLAGNDERDALGEAEEFLLDLLADRERHPASDIYKAAGKQHISVDRLKRARKKIGARTEKAGYDGGWEWYLPENSVEGNNPTLRREKREESTRGETVNSSFSSLPSWRNAEERSAPFDTKGSEHQECEASEDEIERLADLARETAARARAVTAATNGNGPASVEVHLGS